jgi:hypothetical protein
MIPYADFEQAINRWKARKAGTPYISGEFPSGAVASEVVNPNTTTSDSGIPNPISE